LPDAAITGLIEETSLKTHLLKLTGSLPSTRIRIFLAGILFRGLKLFLRKNDYTVRRMGIRYGLDLTEFIDLSIFVLGGFQMHLAACKYFRLPDNAVIIDVGANIGAMTLQFAKKWTQSTVYALEPTDMAYDKLLHNLALNPDLAKRIKPCRVLAADSSLALSVCRSAYASWKVTGGNKGACHPVHGGERQSISPVEQLSLDDFCQKNAISALDLIKIDTDGGELKILKGSRQLLARHRPVLIFEAGDYLMKEHHTTFYDYYDFLKTFGYVLINSKNGREITPVNFHRHIPLKATIDIVAVPPHPSIYTPLTANQRSYIKQK
jgi:FkbM family methyltransferase